MLAYDYPLLGLFWTMLWFFLWIAWLVALFQIIGDIFNSDDLGGWGKAIWLIFVILLPLLGVLIYLIARGGDMTNVFGPFASTIGLLAYVSLLIQIFVFATEVNVVRSKRLWPRALTEHLGEPDLRAIELSMGREALFDPDIVDD